jgi:hypothetical protein
MEQLILVVVAGTVTVTVVVQAVVVQAVVVSAVVELAAAVVAAAVEMVPAVVMETALSAAVQHNHTTQQRNRSSVQNWHKGLQLKCKACLE